MLLPRRLAFRLSLAANFAVLGLKGKVKLGEVKRKYYELAKQYHPDVNKEDADAQKKFTELTKVRPSPLRPTSSSLTTMTRSTASSPTRLPRRITPALMLPSSKTTSSRKPGPKRTPTRTFTSTTISSGTPRNSGSQSRARTFT
jgi:hypothetical protein